MATRANVETVLVKRASALMQFVGMVVTVAGTNADLADPIAFGLRKCGYSVSDITNPTSDEVASCETENIDMLLDVAEYRLLLNIFGNLDEVTVSISGQSESYNDIRTGLEKRIEKLSDKLENEYGFGSAGVSMDTGYISMNIADHNDDISEEYQDE